MPIIFREYEADVEYGDLWQVGNCSGVKRSQLREGCIHPEQRLRIISPFLGTIRR